MEIDIAVIGGGVVGCAILRTLALEGFDCILLEKNNQILCGASGGNSGLLHTGFDATPHSLESELLKNGFRELRNLQKEIGIPFQETGGLMVAWNEEELKEFPEILKKAHDNGVNNVQQISLEQLYQREPGISQTAKGAIFIPGETSVDPWLIPIFYLAQALHNGAKIKLNCEVISGNFNSCEGGKSWKLKTKSGETITCRTVINCGGLYGDKIEQINQKPKFSIIPRQGQFVVYPHSEHLNSMIIPIPTKRTKGIFVYKAVYNQLIVGPTAEEVPHREDGKTDPETITKLIQKGIQVIPHIKTQNNPVVYAGLRPATEYSDYIIEPQPERMWITVAGIRSTGLTASLGIARYVVDQFCSGFLLQNNFKSHRNVKKHNDVISEAKSIVQDLLYQLEMNKGSGVQLGQDFFQVTHPIHKTKYQNTSKL